MRIVCANGWRPWSDEVPTGNAIYGRLQNGDEVLLRYLRYKPDGARQMGASGRWQEANDYGGWRTLAHTVVEWSPVERLP